ncbi:C-3',4' desaturase CrtD [Singulisphaera sp. GP187]|uniref:phytoene desaturase family protein n=1 Tax=Singulisphaera sp. GP187 TaxID=1882752 RepID=UPI000929F4D1|nr:NAD(P)/FAD-dependent oxidoreductase [Singulisphaera sp. GP187]SIO62418.1 C-3',4' desaturase CrtD [Singulisphaera sp. GP187]
MYDVAIIGGGIAGMGTAARLQARGLSTIVLEAHGQPGGCAGYFRRNGFSFDVGATTLVDFGPGGVGGELLESIGMLPIEGDALPGYVAWLPDRTVTLHRDPALWSRERLKALGDTQAHRSLWLLLDRLAGVFWRASRVGVRLPIRGLDDALRAARAVGLDGLPLVRYLSWTLADALRARGLGDDRALVGLLSMLVEDTVHSSVAEAPLINAALGITIRGAGLTRARGGMRGFWHSLIARYRELGGELRVGCSVERVEGQGRSYHVTTRRGVISAIQVVAAVPARLAARLGPEPIAEALAPFLRRDANAVGGAVVVFLGVPDDEVAGQAFTHHQLLHDYDQPLGNGNNMFVSVSTPGDTASAPAGFRALMISTHCKLDPWEGLTPEAYRARKHEVGERLITMARRVYPELGRGAVVREVATPATYERFTRRPRGAVGGVRQTLANTNQHAIPHDLGLPGYWLVGDSTWPGLGTVACCLGSRLVAAGVLAEGSRRVRPNRFPTARARGAAHAIRNAH